MQRTLVLGILFVGAGVLGIYGSLTGNLGPMLAALFDPSALTKASTVKILPTGNATLGVFGKFATTPTKVKPLLTQPAA